MYNTLEEYSTFIKGLEEKFESIASQITYYLVNTRKSRGITIQSIANKMIYSYSTLLEFERGNSKNIFIYLLYMDILNISFGDIQEYLNKEGD